LGEIMAEIILKAGTADERWQLARFSKRRKS
jgi:hypothetical protein